MSAAVKRCGCGAVHSAEAWRRLPFVGISDLGGDRLELRNCPDPCGSTLAIDLAPDASVCMGCGLHLVSETKIVGEQGGVHCHKCAVRAGILLVFPPPRGVYRSTTAGAGMY